MTLDQSRKLAQLGYPQTKPAYVHHCEDGDVVIPDEVGIMDWLCEQTATTITLRRCIAGFRWSACCVGKNEGTQGDTALDALYALALKVRGENNG